MKRSRAVVALPILAVALAACGQAGEPDGPSPTSTATGPTATAAGPTANATGPTSLVDSPPEGDLPAGDYYLDLPAYPARIDFEVPEGWWHFFPATREGSDAHAILVNSYDTGAANGSAWGLAFTVVGQVRADPCDVGAGFMPASAAESAEALADAFSSWEAFPATSVEDVTVGTFSGKRVEIARGETATCSVQTLFETPTGYEFEPIFSSSEPMVNQFTFLNVEDSVLIIWTTDFPGTTLFEEVGGASPDPDAHVADQAQLHDILDSIVISPR